MWTLIVRRDFVHPIHNAVHPDLVEVHELGPKDAPSWTINFGMVPPSQDVPKFCSKNNAVYDTFYLNNMNGMTKLLRDML